MVFCEAQVDVVQNNEVRVISARCRMGSTADVARCMICVNCGSRVDTPSHYVWRRLSTLRRSNVRFSECQDITVLSIYLALS